VLIPRAGLPTLKLYFKINHVSRTLIEARMWASWVLEARPSRDCCHHGLAQFLETSLINPAASYDAKRNVAFTIPVACEGLAGIPQGASYATITVDTAGKTTVSGKLADEIARP